MRQIRQGLSLEQQQKLYMTTELKQAISVLQMSALELNEYVLKTIEENPFLEEAETNFESGDTDQEKISNCVNMETILEQLHDDNTNYMGSPEPKEEYPFEKYLSDESSLDEHLRSQLCLELRHPIDVLIGHYLIGSIDRNGYLCSELADIARVLHVDAADVEAVLAVIQTFHPPGIGARSLQECLLLQLAASGKETELARQIIEDHLEDIAAKKLNKIASTFSVSVKKVQEIYDLIRSFDPKPGLQYEYEHNPVIWPDVTVVKDPEGYSVLVQDFDFPQLRINQNYASLFRQAAVGGDARKYLEEKLESALGLIRGIEQRRMNVFKVVSCIVDVQREFLDKGVKYLKPLTMGQVAEVAEIHESTVSRVVSSKYVQTPRGMFSLKYFFNSGLSSAAESDKISSKSIKHQIQELVTQEDPTQPLSDQEIMNKLNEKGIQISRRTVNKYRQSLGIPSNTLRKRYE